MNNINNMKYVAKGIAIALAGSMVFGVNIYANEDSNVTNNRANEAATASVSVDSIELIASIDSVSDPIAQIANNQKLQAVSSGQCGDNLQYDMVVDGYDDDENTVFLKLIISGTGPMNDYEGDDDSCPEWDRYFEIFDYEIPCDYDVTVVLEEGITRIGNYAFSNESRMELGTAKFKFPESVTEIGDYAFHRNFELAGKLELPSHLERIGKSAFEECYELNGDLVIPASVEYIDESAFESCRDLNGFLVLNDGLKYIGDKAFMTCDSMRGKIELPSTLEYIGDEAFAWDSGFDGDIRIPAACRHIGERAFYEYAKDGKKGSVIIENGIAAIGVAAFENANIGGTLSIPKSVEIIDDMAFYNTKITGDLIIPDSVKEIGTKAFYSCDKLNGNLKLSDGLTKIGEAAFMGCDNLNGDLVIPDSVEVIEKAAFCGLDNIDGTLTIGKGLNRIEEKVFYQCGCKGELIIPSNIEYIGENSFYNCYRVNKLTLNEGLKMIDSYAFSDCYDMSGEFTVPSSLETIGSHAFEETGYKGTLVIPETIKKIGVNPFWLCKGIDKVINNSNAQVELPYVQGYFWTNTESGFVSDYLKKGTAWRSPESYLEIFNINGRDEIVKIHIDGGHYESDKYLKTAAGYKLLKPVKKGYKFKGFYINLGKKQKKIVKIDPKTLALIGTKTVCAEWEPCTYKVIYKINKPGMGVKIIGKPKNAKVAFDDMYTLPDEVYAASANRIAYEVTGWTLAPGDMSTLIKDDKLYMAAGYDKEHKAITLYPIWEEVKVMGK